MRDNRVTARFALLSQFMAGIAKYGKYRHSRVSKAVKFKNCVNTSCGATSIFFKTMRVTFEGSWSVVPGFTEYVNGYSSFRMVRKV